MKPKPWLADLHPYEPGRPIEEIQARFADRTVIKLASNESPYGCSPTVSDAVRAQLPELHRYPDGGSHLLRKALGTFLGLAAENLIIGNGSNELIELLIQAYLGPGDTLYTSEATFAVYPLAAKARGARVVQFPLKDFRYDLEAFSDIPENGGLICIADPNNPTGTTCDMDCLKDLFANRPDLLFLYDAAYEEYRDNSGSETWATWLKEFPNVLVARTFSKAYGLAGLRVGYGFASNEIVEALHRVRQPFNVNRLAQVAALAALQDQQHVRMVIERNARARQGIYQFCEQERLTYQRSETNFVLLSVPSLPGKGPLANRWAEAMLSEGIIIRAMTGFGLPNHIRINTGTEQEMERFFAAFKKLRG